MNDFIIFHLIIAALYYLGSRAVITSWLWSRYPSSVAHFMDCSACSGFWYGLAVALVIGRGLQLSYLGLDPFAWSTPLLVGACSIAMNPIAAGLMQRGLDQLGVITEETDGHHQG